MNTPERDILLWLKRAKFVNQRILSEQTGYSLGRVNQSLRLLQSGGYLDPGMGLTEKAETELERLRPRNAVILAAGYGMRMLPMNAEIPKGLIRIDGEALIDRLILQLLEAGVRDITVVVGFMKEAYEYLIDRFGVKLCVNMEYAGKNNLRSLALVSGEIENTYILPCDIWCGSNPFGRGELYSWYMVCDLFDDESYVRVNRKQELVRTEDGGNQMIGISYISADTAPLLRQRLAEMDGDARYDDCFWEDALFRQNRMLASARMASSKNTFEIDTYEQLRELDPAARELNSAAIGIICGAFDVTPSQVEDITVVKKGMTNRSFRFTCKGGQYLMRVPGAGTDRLINRRQEYEVYRQIRDSALCDNIIFIDPETGYKITEYWEDARTCDTEDAEDLLRCMAFLRSFHSKEFQVGHFFDIFGQIEFYESLWNGLPSCYGDYGETKAGVMELKAYIEAQPRALCLTHIDAVPDNFLFINGGTEIRLIDWEYAATQDPHVDIAMFIIYSMYGREQAEGLIDAYFTEGCPEATRRKIYAYIAACGLLWSNWCEYKRHLGVEFGEYSLRQYRYAKDYYRLLKECGALDRAEPRE